jgi:hypothetical protein
MISISNDKRRKYLTYGVPTVKNPRHSFPMVITIPAYRAVGQLHREEA